jgi:hypothetical protein
MKTHPVREVISLKIIWSSSIIPPSDLVYEHNPD